ncbi:rCG25524 [Rattus norvegicus]|uniref:RCG25524 n=1 Tax=Rattus norvegicus TaxID=10116 RepID=A6I423_RAT|nr:rCG25524 [Rattus norvegicus]
MRSHFAFLASHF